MKTPGKSGFHAVSALRAGLLLALVAGCADAAKKPGMDAAPACGVGSCSSGQTCTGQSKCGEVMCTCTPSRVWSCSKCADEDGGMGGGGGGGAGGMDASEGGGGMGGGGAPDGGGSDTPASDVPASDGTKPDVVVDTPMTDVPVTDMSSEPPSGMCGPSGAMCSMMAETCMSCTGFILTYCKCAMGLTGLTWTCTFGVCPSDAGVFPDASGDGSGMCGPDKGKCDPSNDTPCGYCDGSTMSTHTCACTAISITGAVWMCVDTTIKC